MCTGLSQQESTEYDVDNTAILKRYNLTSKGFDNKFRTTRGQAGEKVSHLKKMTKADGSWKKMLEFCPDSSTSEEEDAIIATCWLLSLPAKRKVRKQRKKRVLGHASPKP
ncbi:hypothetical protein ElyMa_002962900 [Elysia marginata]|uniref:Uncharacterized protein n=1 Tax=Elysia marginata TaxID=1093978 RepID=A0AAV4I9Z1_9GAST|nr:hypothetical protein ElyMa_002962900 [Elysia marginata]